VFDYNEEVAKVEGLRDTPKVGAGTNPAVVVVDFQIAFTEHALCTEHTVESMKATALLADKARSLGIPVVYLAVTYDTLEDVPLTWRKPDGIFSSCQRGKPTVMINPIVAMGTDDLLVEKTHASGFFSTDLHEQLQARGIDTLLMAGTSTSGCVRATAVDAAARSYRVQIIEECCDDWRPVSDAAALYDLADRYADVVHLDAMLTYLDTVPVPTATSVA
jgi:maleamate amidohydrolase